MTENPLRARFLQNNPRQPAPSKNSENPLRARFLQNNPRQSKPQGLVAAVPKPFNPAKPATEGQRLPQSAIDGAKMADAEFGDGVGGFMQRGLVGVGRGAINAYEGVKQFAGLTDEKEDQRIQDERALWDAGTGDTWAGSIGEVAGEVAATAAPGGLLLRGLSNGGKALGIASKIPAGLKGAGIQASAGGAAAGGLQFVEDGQTRLGNAAQGAALGLAAQKGLAAAGRGINRLRARRGSGNQPDVLTPRGIPTPDAIQGLKGAAVPANEISQSALRRADELTKAGLAPAQAIRQAEAEDLGINLTRGQVTREFADQQFENETAKHIGREAQPLRQQFNQQNQQLNQQLDNIQTRTGATADGIEDTGIAVRRSLESGKRQQDDLTRAEYDQAVEAATAKARPLTAGSTRALPIVEDSDLSAIAEKTIPGAKIEKTSSYEHTITMPDGRVAILADFDSGNVKLNASSLIPGKHNGSAIYDVAATYAHNNGKVFRGEDMLTDQGNIRRIENMLTSANKFGTTKHIAPSKMQLEAGAGVIRPIRWGDNDADNIAELRETSYANISSLVPEIKDITYDRGRLLKNGEPVSDTELKTILKRATRRASTAQEKDRLQVIGLNTLKRAPITKAQIDNPNGIPAVPTGDMVIPQNLQRILNEELDYVDSVPQLKGVQNQLKRFGALLNDGSLGKGMNLRRSEILRRRLGDLAAGSNDANASRIFKNLQSQLDDDIMASAGEDVFKNARAAAKQGFARYKDVNPVRAILDGKVADEKIINGVVGNKWSADDLRGFKGTLNTFDEGGQGLSELKGGIVNWIRDQAVQGRAIDELGNPIISGANFQKALQKIGDAKLKVMFEPEELRVLKQLSRVAQNITTKVPGSVNTSNTASASFNRLARVLEQAPGINITLGPLLNMFRAGVRNISDEKGAQAALDPLRSVAKSNRQQRRAARRGELNQKSRAKREAHIIGIGGGATLPNDDSM